MKKKKVLICGASGFIGRNIYETLSRNPNLEVAGTYHKRKCTFQRCIDRVDLTNRGDVMRALRGYDVVIQAAAVTSGVKDIVNRPYIHVTDNVIMNALLTQAAYEAGVSQFIFLSCSVMYPMHLSRPVDEKDVYRELIDDKYRMGALTKLYIEDLCKFYSQLGRTKFAVVRHSNIYGPHDKFDLERSHVFGATMTKVMNAPEGGEIVVWGNGSEARDLLYVSDLVSFVERMINANHDAYELCNIGSGRATSIREIVERIIFESGKKLSVAYDTTKPTISGQVILDATKAREKFGWEPKVSLEEGIQKTLAWYQGNILHFA